MLPLYPWQNEPPKCFVAATLALTSIGRVYLYCHVVFDERLFPFNEVTNIISAAKVSTHSFFPLMEMVAASSRETNPAPNHLPTQIIETFAIPITN